WTPVSHPWSVSVTARYTRTHRRMVNRLPVISSTVIATNVPFHPAVHGGGSTASARACSSPVPSTCAGPLTTTLVALSSSTASVSNATQPLICTPSSLLPSAVRNNSRPPSGTALIGTMFTSSAIR